MPVIPFLARTFDASPFQIGFLYSGYALTQVRADPRPRSGRASPLHCLLADGGERGGRASVGPVRDLKRRAHVLAVT